jgi:hypothetical protein
MGGGGYLWGMTQWNEQLIAKLHKAIVGNLNEFGLIVGLSVGGLDVAVGLIGKAIGAALFHVGSDGDLPQTFQDRINPYKDRRDDMVRASMANAVKNSPRVLAVVIQSLAENHALLGPVTRAWQDRVDISDIDGGMGLGSTSWVARNKMERRYKQRLLIGDPDKLLSPSDAWKGDSTSRSPSGPGQRSPLSLRPL